jgi:hypothetical protein
MLLWMPTSHKLLVVSPRKTRFFYAHIDKLFSGGILTQDQILTALRERFDPEVKLNLVPYGDRAEGLKSVARYLVERKN